MKSRKPAIGFIFLTLVIDILGIGLIIPNLPELVRQFEGGSTSSAAGVYGLLGALYALMQFGFAPVMGSLSDQFGRRPVILASLFGSGVDYLFLAFAPSLGWFFVGRAVSGITGASITAANAYIADITPPEKRAQSFGIIGAAFGLGFIIGPALGGFLGSYSLKLPFIVAACLTLTNWLYGYFVVPESLAPENRRKFSWARANPVGSFSALTRFPVVWGLAGTFFCLYLAHTTLQSTWVLYTSYRYGWSPKQTGASLAVVGLMAAIVQGGLVRVVVPKIGERRAIIFGLSISALNFLCYGLATHGWMIYVVLVAGSIGAVAGPAAQGLISRNIPPDEQGAVQGAMTSMMSACGIIGPPIATGLFGYFIGPTAPIHLPGISFFVGSGLVLTALALAIRSFRRTPAAAEPARTAPVPG
jgi:DHA1 family tetracycline resistance protein-like MFS transporter